MSASSPVTVMEVDENNVKESAQTLQSNGDMNGSCDDGSLDAVDSPESSQQPQDSGNSNDSSRYADIQKVPSNSEVPEPMEQGSESEGNMEDDGEVDKDGSEGVAPDSDEENTGDNSELHENNVVVEASIADSVEQAELANGTEDDDEVEGLEEDGEGQDEGDEAISINSGTSDDEDVPVESVNINDSDNSEDGSDNVEIHSDYSNKNSTSNQHDDRSNEKQRKSADSGDVITLVESKSNGEVCSSPEVEEICDTSDDVVNLDETPKKKKKAGDPQTITPRRSSRNLHKQKSYIDDEDEPSTTKSVKTHDVDDDDIEEITPDDPLGLGDTVHHVPPKDKPRPTSMSGGTIVVKDTKRLAEIASISSKPTTPSSGKKEPTLVIIDTNSILSGRGPVPMQNKLQNQTPSYSVLPIGLPAQGVYPPNMRATITPIPMAKQQTQPNILPSLTDDMYVVEAPSFIVPYVYEKPPVKPLKEFVVQYGKEVEKAEEELRKEEGGGDDDSEEESQENGVDKKPEPPKSTSYFDNPLGKFFYNIGFNLVQEFVQTDLLKQQKRKRDREGNAPATAMAIQSLIKNLEFSKENNEPYRMEMKKCDYCSFKTESALALAHHLETPHMRNFVYKCNFCPLEVRSPHDILFHMEAEHNTRGRLERAPAFHQCPNCPFEDNQKGKLSRHLIACAKKFKPEKNMEPPADWEPPAKIPRLSRGKQVALVPGASPYPTFTQNKNIPILPQRLGAPNSQAAAALMRQRNQNNRPNMVGKVPIRPGMIYRPNTPGQVLVPTTYQYGGNQIYTVVNGDGDSVSKSGGSTKSLSIRTQGGNSFTIQASGGGTSTSANRGQIPSKLVHQPSISITPLPRNSNANNAASQAAAMAAAAAPAMPMPSVKPGDPAAGKATFVICEICDGYIKDLEQLRNHMQWIHKVKIHPKMIYNRPPLNCQKCQFRFFTDQGLERHLLGSHGLVTSSMQEAANKGKDAGRCPVCGRVYQWKLLNHVARDHKITLKPAHLSYKCTVCTATFGMYKQFENHVYSAHSVVAKRVIEKKNNVQANRSSSNDSLLKPLKINDEITIIPQPAKPKAGTSNRGE